MLVDDELSELTLARAPYEELARAAAAAGTRALWEDGLEKALAGLTSIEELRDAFPGAVKSEPSAAEPGAGSP